MQLITFDQSSAADVEVIEKRHIFLLIKAES